MEKNKINKQGGKNMKKSIKQQLKEINTFSFGFCVAFAIVVLFKQVFKLW